LGLGIGASLLAAPFLDLLERPVRADNSKVAKRLVVFFSPNGTIPAHWTPAGTGASYSFPAGSILEPLAGTTDPVLGTLPSIQADVIVCGGLDFFNTANHLPGIAAMLTANGIASSTSGGMSVDQYVAAAIGQKTKFRSLEFGVQSSFHSSGTDRMSYSGAGATIPSEDDPLNAYGRMFSDLLAGPQAAALMLQKRKSVLDLATAELQALRARVGAAEQAKLDAHLAALRQVEQGLTTSGGCSALPKAPSQLPAGTTDTTDGNIPLLGKQQMDLLVTALSCGLTNVASIQWSHTVGQPSFPWLGFSDEHHSLSHSDDGATDGVAKFVTAERWFAAQFSYLVNQLKNAMDPKGGSLLDSTLVVWAKELGDSRAHVCTGVPFVLAGSCNTRFQTGRYVDFNHAPHGQLLVSICQAMGLANQTFGAEGSGTGPLPGLA
jgi:hypothetical protein